MATPTTKVTDLVNQLKRELDAAQAENEQLVQKNAQLNSDISAAEDRERIAEGRALEAEKKRDALEAFAAASYKEVVSELFDEPSRRATTATIRWAAISIVVGLIATIWSSLYSARMSSKSATQLTKAIDGQFAQRIEVNNNKIVDELHRTEDRVKQIVQAAVQPRQRERSLLLTNKCDQTIVIAVHYLTATHNWITIGWFVIQPGSTFNPKIRPVGDVVFFYGKSPSGLNWKAEGLENQLSIRLAVDEVKAFTTPGDALTRPQTVPFFGRALQDESEIMESFTCAK